MSSNQLQPTVDDLLDLQLLPNGFSELVVQVTRSGKLTQADRYGLIAVLMKPDTTPEEFFWIDRLQWRLQQGYLEIVDDLSTLSVS